MTFAHVGRKACGCATWARLDAPGVPRYFKQKALAAAERDGLTVKRVPVEQAGVVICGCES